MEETVNFCTLFDSNYIDRALLMYESLMRSCGNAALYVIAFDYKCETVLRELGLSNMIIIGYDDFEDNTLIEAKANRSIKSFFWTCSCYSIRYIMKRFNLNECTYIDADMYFYCSPRPAIERFIDSTKDVAIISHRFSNHIENNYTSRLYGKYCVEFNSFKNTVNGMRVLDWWIERCLEFCPDQAVDGLFGDQKYLEKFEDLFDGIYIYQDFGLGIAPWNIDDYIRNGELIENRNTHECGKIVFYHFHSLDIYEDGTSNIKVFIRPGKHDRKLIEQIYRPYIKSLIDKRLYLRDHYKLFDYCNREFKTVRVKSEEIKIFLTCEPNFYFLIRKIWRYLVHKTKDYITV